MEFTELFQTQSQGFKRAALPNGFQGLSLSYHGRRLYFILSNFDSQGLGAERHWQICYILFKYSGEVACGWFWRGVIA
jgi:hypothetical protein